MRIRWVQHGRHFEHDCTVEVVGHPFDLERICLAWETSHSITYLSADTSGLRSSIEPTIQANVHGRQ
jgi:hypothetical protein